MSESSDAPAVQDSRVTDVDGHEVDDTTLDWLVFIAFHMEADRDFLATELLIDLLLMLGYRDDEKIASLAGESRYRTALRSTLGRLGDQDSRLVRDVVVEGDEALHYELTQKRVQDIREVADAIGGTVWGDAGTDEIDTYSEVAWLAIMALRLEDGHSLLGMGTGGRHLLTRDELLGVLDSVWRHGDEADTRLELNRTLGMLKDENYVELKKERRIVGPEGWALTDKAWGGVYSLRDQLKEDIIGQVSPVEDAPQEPQTLVTNDMSTTDALASADRVSQDGQRDNEDEHSTFPLRGGSAETEDDVSLSTGALLVPISASSGHGEVVVRDVDLCFAVLDSLADEAAKTESLSEGDLVERVVARLDIPPSYLDKPLPPWTTASDKDSNQWVAGLRRAGRDPKLIDYRMEHVFRALSIEQVGLIRDEGLASSQASQNRWSLTDSATKALLSARSTKTEGNQPHVLPDAVSDYFRMHSYEGWHAENWMKGVIDEFWKMGGTVGGVAFESLTKALVEAHPAFSEATLQMHDGYLDRAGVDIVAHIRADATNDEGRGWATAFNSKRLALLVQCKRHLWVDIPPDAASKLFATTAWLRGQALLGHFNDGISGALLVFFGDLSREATWTVWALKAAWDSMEEAKRAHAGTSTGTQPNIPLTWEIWDSRAVFQLMKEHEIGVSVDNTSGGETVTLDEHYFSKLANEAEASIAKMAEEKEKRKAAKAAGRR